MGETDVRVEGDADIIVSGRRVRWIEGIAVWVVVGDDREPVPQAQGVAVNGGHPPAGRLCADIQVKVEINLIRTRYVGTQGERESEAVVQAVRRDLCPLLDSPIEGEETVVGWHLLQIERGWWRAVKGRDRDRFTGDDMATIDIELADLQAIIGVQIR